MKNCWREFNTEARAAGVLRRIKPGPLNEKAEENSVENV